MSAVFRVLYVINDADFFVSHWLSLAHAAREAGFDVHVATPYGSGCKRIQGEGFPLHVIPLNRRGRRIRQEVSTLAALFRLYRSLHPDLVHHFTIKPVIYGGIVARIVRVPAVVNAVTGLGYVFIAQGFKASVQRAAVKQAYRFALAQRNGRTIFENSDDLEMFVNVGLVKNSDAVLIKGSGVDIDEFVPTAEAGGIPIVVLAARMLWDKGVAEFVQSARQLINAGVKARFVLVGDSDPGNPTAVPRTKLQAWNRSGMVEWWGRRSDMPRVFAESHIVCLPSYREGLPKVLVEAASSGRPIVTTDVPGCRDVVEDGQNGIVVPAKNATALAQALRRLIENPALRQQMGRKGRALVESELSTGKVVVERLALYRTLLR